jgi:hypothetical protein
MRQPKSRSRDSWRFSTSVTGPRLSDLARSSTEPRLDPHHAALRSLERRGEPRRGGADFENGLGRKRGVHHHHTRRATGPLQSAYFARGPRNGFIGRTCLFMLMIFNIDQMAHPNKRRGDPRPGKGRRGLWRQQHTSWSAPTVAATTKQVCLQILCT